MKKQDNYQIQLQQAQKHFLTYDQRELIDRCHLQFDSNYFYVTMLARRYRIDRYTGCMEWQADGTWIDGNSFGEVMTLLDWLCDSKPDRHLARRWVNLVTHGHYFHRNLQEGEDANAALFDKRPADFRKACEALGGRPMPGADIGYAIELLDGLEIFVQLWHGDEEFAPRLRCLWDENTEQYLRYETTWYAVGLLMRRLREHIT